MPIELQLPTWNINYAHSYPMHIELFWDFLHRFVRILIEFGNKNLANLHK